MNTTAPLKRHPAIVSFSRDHHFGLLLVWKIRQGLRKELDPQRISAYLLYFFKNDLEPHFSDEELYLFSRLPLHDALRQKAESEHHHLRALIAQIEKKNDDTALLRQLADAIEAHIRFEERTLFNHLQQMLGAEELGRIEQRLGSGSKALDDQWQDQFWEEKR